MATDSRDAGSAGGLGVRSGTLRLYVVTRCDFDRAVVEPGSRRGRGVDGLMVDKGAVGEA